MDGGKKYNENDVLSNQINKEKNDNAPFIKDFTFFKSRYQKQ